MQPRRKVEGIDAELDLAPTSHVSVNVAIAVPSAALKRPHARRHGATERDAET
ncbi:MAG: hypothetical protein Q27BB25_05565 [Blastomonas sp. CACIA14H2]|uniref:hypothetical protein n=1 Tax=unclassified Blastomonas TaxID=2626550 RepID=UPI0003D06A9D|nr:MAG: hypothetical protein Q27BB25_05565 [Blastomonas sp. CACIA14H2]